MATSRTSVRAANPTVNSVRTEGIGGIAARRVVVTAAGTSVTLPARFTSFLAKNAGITDARIAFNADTIATQYFTIAAGAQLPVITINDKTTVKLITAAGSTTVEVILWG